MYARVTTFQLQPGTADEFKQYGQDIILPHLKQVPGFKRGVALQNDALGKFLTIVILETEEHLQAMENTGFHPKHYEAFAHNFSAVPVVERYEVVAQTTQGEKLPGYARFTSVLVHPDKIDEAIDFTHNVISLNKQEPGFGG